MQPVIDPENKIVKLCAAGMQAEFVSDPARAKTLFLQAWNESETDSEKFIAAHYVARHQADQEETLKWNQEALNYALRVDGEEIKSHLPSLYLNLAKSYEDLGDLSAAAENYQLAADYCTLNADSTYVQTIRSGISRGLARTSGKKGAIPELETLINAWCARKDLKSLAAVLPAWVSSLNTAGDRQRIASALGFLVAAKNLPPAEQSQAEQIMQQLTDH